MISFVQERVKIVSEINFISLQKLIMEWKKDEHAYIEVEGIIDSESNETNHYIESIIKVYDVEDSEELLFSGIIMGLELKCEGMIYTVKLQCYSRTILLDREEKNCSYQNIHLTYLTIIQNIMQETKASKVICNQEDKQIEFPIIRYKETDWQFIKRLAACLKTSVIPLVVGDGSGIAIGLMEGKVNKIDKFNNVKYIIDKDKCLFYEIINHEKWYIGDSIIYKGHRFYVVEKSAEFTDSCLQYTYLLANRSYLRKCKYINVSLKGISLKGNVIDVEGEKVKLHLLIDKKQEIEEAYWFPYLPETGNIMYCMPEIGDMVCLYLGCGEERDAIAINCIREGSGARDGAFLVPPYGKKMLIEQKEIGYDCESEKGHGRFLIQDKEIIIHENRKIKLVAENMLSLQAKNLQVIAPDEVTLMKRGIIQPSVINLCRFVDIIAMGSGIQCTNKMSNVKTISDDIDEEIYELGENEKDILATIPFDGTQDSVAKCLFKSSMYIGEEV